MVELDILLELGVVDSVTGGVHLEGEGLVQGSLQLEVHVEVLVVHLLFQGGRGGLLGVLHPLHQVVGIWLAHSVPGSYT